ncbi:hypothetical protein ASG57_27050 [Bradyrhizobium sp. Leaf396]|nr:hypothetical protein ASG57_27050 [Bradyrhizobium sp. Leaf396]
MIITKRSILLFFQCDHAASNQQEGFSNSIMVGAATTSGGPVPSPTMIRGWDPRFSRRRFC